MNHRVYTRAFNEHCSKLPPALIADQIGSHCHKHAVITSVFLSMNC